MLSAQAYFFVTSVKRFNTDLAVIDSMNAFTMVTRFMQVPVFNIIVLPCVFLGCFLSMFLGSAIAREEANRVIRTVERTYTEVGGPSSNWDKRVAAPSVRLHDLFEQLSGFGSGLGGATIALWSTSLGLFVNEINRPFVAAQIKNGTGQGMTYQIMSAVLAMLPLLLAANVAEASTRCAVLTNALNMKRTRKNHDEITWLETRLTKLNREQGLGFKVFGTVIDKLKLQHLATAMASTIISVAALLALGEETIETASQSASCNMTASQVATAKALFGGSTCNTTIQEILQL